MHASLDPIGAETHELYLHLLHLKRRDGAPATDRALLHREIAHATEILTLDAGMLEAFYEGRQELDGPRLNALRTVLDRAHRNAVDPMFTWKPRWLNSPQGAQYAHPRIHALAAPSAADA